MKSTRSYTMTSRARATEETRTRILEATVDLVTERLAADISLDSVAQRSGVSVQTVLRHFGSRAGLFGAAHSHAETKIVEERRVPVGDALLELDRHSLQLFVRHRDEVVLDGVDRLGDGFELADDLALADTQDLVDDRHAD